MLRALFISALLCGSSIDATPIYRVSAVGQNGSVTSTISATGEVGGTTYFPNGTFAGFAGARSFPAASVRNVNEAGTAVGYTVTEQGRRATVWTDSSSVFIGAAESYANSVNTSGVVVGSAVGETGRSYAFVHDASGTQSIATGGASSVAYGINDQGQVVGKYSLDDVNFRAFSWTAAGGVRNLGTLGGASSQAMALNNAGLIVGLSINARGYYEAFVDHGAGMRGLGTLGGASSAAYAVDGSGHVVGYSYDGLGRQRAFIWMGGALLDLNSLIDPDSGWVLEAAYALNDRGQVTGTGLWNGTATSFQLDPPSPRVDETAAVPEPRAAVLMLAGLGLIGGALVRRKLHKRSSLTS